MAQSNAKDNPQSGTSVLAGGWLRAKSSSQYRELLLATLHVAATHFGLCGCIGARIGQGVSALEGIVEWRAQAMDLGYADARYGSLIISSYPTGQIGFLLCTKSLGGGESPPSLSDIEERYTDMVRRGKRTAYYQPKLQFSSFDLPLWVEEAMYGTSIISQIEGEGDEL